MSKSTFLQSDEFRRGTTGEHLVALQLQRKGWYVIPSYDYSGKDNDKAPKLQGLSKGFVLPDLGVAKDGVSRWVEVKTKAAPSLGKRSGKMEHGIPLRHYEDYLRVQQITGLPVYLCIYEELSGCLLIQSLDRLGQTAEHETPMRTSIMRKGGREGGQMVYFTRDRFVPWCSVVAKQGVTQ